MSFTIENPFVIFGAGGHARVVLDSALMTDLVPAFIVDDKPTAHHLYGIPIVSSNDSRWMNLVRFRYTVAIGDNSIRQVLYQKLLGRGGIPCSVIHPSAKISPFAKVGLGSMVFAGSVVNAGAEVGVNVILNTSCSVDHDCQVNDHSHLCPGVRLAGSVRIGEMTMIGIGSCIIPGVRIGRNVVVGAGSVVVRDLPDKMIAFGNPARQRISSR